MRNLGVVVIVLGIGLLGLVLLGVTGGTNVKTVAVLAMALMGVGYFLYKRG